MTLDLFEEVTCRAFPRNQSRCYIGIFSGTFLISFLTDFDELLGLGDGIVGSLVVVAVHGEGQTGLLRSPTKVKSSKRTTTRGTFTLLSLPAIDPQTWSDQIDCFEQTKCKTKRSKTAELTEIIQEREGALS